MVWYRSYYICNRNPTSALTYDRCPLKPRTRRAQDIEDLVWETTTDVLSDRGLLSNAIQRWNQTHDEDAETTSGRLATYRKRLDEIRAERLRTFRDGRRLGLSDLEVEDLLQQLAAEPDHIEGQIASISSATLAQDLTRTDLSQLLQQAPRRLAHADVDTRAVILELLDVTVTPTEDGYHIEASIPLDPDDTSEDPGYIASLAPRPAP